MIRWLTISVLLSLLTWGIAQAESIVLYYSFDGGGGDTVRDESGNGNDGKLNGPKWVDGKYGGGLQFEQGDFVQIPASDTLHGDIFKNGEFTLCLWIKPSLSGDQWQQIWRSVSGDSSRDTLFLNIDGRLSWRGRVGGQWTVMCETDPGILAADQWFHVAVVGDKSKFRIYVNGELKKETDFQESDGQIDVFFLGFDNRQWMERYAGVMDEVCLFAEPLSPDEIAKVMEGAKGFLAVRSEGKLATTWGQLKVR